MADGSFVVDETVARIVHRDGPAPYSFPFNVAGAPALSYQAALTVTHLMGQIGLLG